MIPAEVEDTIATARRRQISTLYFSARTLTILPESIIVLPSKPNGSSESIATNKYDDFFHYSSNENV
jgi:hypothetical protein